MSSLKRTDARDAATIAVAVGVVGVSFGALAPSAGLSPAMTMAMSAFVFAGGAQLAVTGILAAGGGITAAVVAGLVLNLRHLPFGLALAGTLARGPSRLAAAHVITDESTAFVLARGTGTDRARRAFWLLGVMKYLTWQVGTALGLVLGTVVPDPTAFGVDAAFPAAMLAMLLPMLRAADAQRVGVGAAAVALLTSPFAPAGVPVLAGLAGVGLAGDRWFRRFLPARLAARLDRRATAPAEPSAAPAADPGAGVDQHGTAPVRAEPCDSAAAGPRVGVDQHVAAPLGAETCDSAAAGSGAGVDQHGTAAARAETCGSAAPGPGAGVDQHGTAPVRAEPCGSAAAGPGARVDQHRTAAARAGTCGSTAGGSSPGRAGGAS